MGKRLFVHSDTVIMSTEKVPKKNERSHEENQERAYIAASRRSDRSIEARLQSARMASEIHKKRTGKGFRITEEIVRKEEMYEEEEDEFPRAYRALTAHLKTSSPLLNQRADAYVTSQFAAAQLARELEINRQFAENFPGVRLSSQMTTQGLYAQPLHQEQSTSLHPFQPAHHFSSPHPMGFDQQPHPQSVAQVTPQPHVGFSQFDQPSPMPRHASFDDALPALTPSSGRTQTPSSSGTPPLVQPDEFRSRAQSTPALPVDPLLGATHANLPYPFTSEIPNNVKGMANIDPSDPAFYMGFVGGELAGSDGAMWPTDFPYSRDVPLPSSEFKHFPATCFESSPGFDAPQLVPEDPIPIPVQESSRIGTPDWNNTNDWKYWIADEGGDGEPEMG